MSGPAGCMYLPDGFLYPAEGGKMPGKQEPGRKGRGQAVRTRKTAAAGRRGEPFPPGEGEGPQDIEDPDGPERTGKNRLARRLFPSGTKEF